VPKLEDYNGDFDAWMQAINKVRLRFKRQNKAFFTLIKTWNTLKELLRKNGADVSQKSAIGVGDTENLEIEDADNTYQLSLCLAAVDPVKEEMSQMHCIGSLLYRKTLREMQCEEFCEE